VTARQEGDVEVSESRVEPVVLVYRYVSWFFSFEGQAYLGDVWKQRDGVKLHHLYFSPYLGCFHGVVGSWRLLQQAECTDWCYFMVKLESAYCLGTGLLLFPISRIVCYCMYCIIWDTGSFLVLHKTKAQTLLRM